MKTSKGVAIEKLMSASNGIGDFFWGTLFLEKIKQQNFKI